jgi:hypothetical protein
VSAYLGSRHPFGLAPPGRAASAPYTQLMGNPRVFFGETVARFGLTLFLRARCILANGVHDFDEWLGALFELC